MIKIAKGDAPNELVVAGTPLVVGLKTNFDNHQAAYINATRTFTFSDCYKSEAVKEALKTRQHNKCCFSEAKFRGDYPHVEHFRPKGRVDHSQPQASTYPGYYWLAYEWSNLFFCKQLINVSYKRNFFPLVDEALRNKNHHDLNVEAPVFIDPSIEEPRDHIRFHEDEPVNHNGSTRGTETITLLGLRHPDFEEGRRKRLQILKTMKDVIDMGIAAGWDINHPILAGPLATLKEAILPESEFSSMAIDFLSGWPHLA